MTDVLDHMRELLAKLPPRGPEAMLVHPSVLACLPRSEDPAGRLFGVQVFVSDYVPTETAYTGPREKISAVANRLDELAAARLLTVDRARRLLAWVALGGDLEAGVDLIVHERIARPSLADLEAREPKGERP